MEESLASLTSRTTQEGNIRDEVKKAMIYFSLPLLDKRYIFTIGLTENFLVLTAEEELRIAPVYYLARFNYENFISLGRMFRICDDIKEVGETFKYFIEQAIKGEPFYEICLIQKDNNELELHMKVVVAEKKCSFYIKLEKVNKEKDKLILDFQRITEIAFKKYGKEGILNELNKNIKLIKTECAFCQTGKNLNKCLCKKIICDKCIELQKNKSCLKSCYIFENGSNCTSTVYNVSKLPLPKNSTIKLYFEKVKYVRAGITFGKEIMFNPKDESDPNYDVYFIAEELWHLYDKNKGWQDISKDRYRLQDGDFMTIIYTPKKLEFFINETPLGKVNISESHKKKEPYLLVHCNNEPSQSKVVIMSITENLY